MALPSCRNSGLKTPDACSNEKDQLESTRCLEKKPKAEHPTDPAPVGEGLLSEVSLQGSGYAAGVYALRAETHNEKPQLETSNQKVRKATKLSMPTAPAPDSDGLLCEVSLRVRVC